MATGIRPTASEILDLMDRLERDPARRHLLSTSWELYREAVNEGVIGRDGIDWLASAMQQLSTDGLIENRSWNGVMTMPPRWSGDSIQQLHDWRVTAPGRANAHIFRQQPRADRGHVIGRQLSDTGPKVAPADEHVGLHDVFISHANEDKQTVARPLAQALSQRGVTVWLDELQLTVGDSLEGRISAALRRCRFGVVILSPAFMRKPWPQRELQGLSARETASGVKVILPVWHQVNREDVVRFSPILADRLSASTDDGIDRVSDRLAEALARIVQQGERPDRSRGAETSGGAGILWVAKS